MQPLAASTTLTEAIGHLLSYFKTLATERGCHNMFSFVQKDTGLHRLLLRTGWQDPKSKEHVYLFTKF